MAKRACVSLQLHFVFPLDLLCCFSLYDLCRNRTHWWCFLMFHTVFYEEFHSYEYHAAPKRQEGQSRTNVSCWLVASTEHSANSFQKDTAGAGICLFCHCGTCCTGTLLYFETHCRTQEQVLALCSSCSPKNSVTKCLRTRPREREGKSANAQKIIVPYVLLVEELTTVHSWLKQFISEKIFFDFGL